MSSRCPRCDGTPLDEPGYAYLLGLYLGDGVHLTRATCLPHSDRSRCPVSPSHLAHRLRCVPGPSRNRWRHGARGVRGGLCVLAALAVLFPSTRPGTEAPALDRSHAMAGGDRRPISTSASERAHPIGRLSRDDRVWGGRCEYSRSFFSNNSEDILRIFREAMRPHRAPPPQPETERRLDRSATGCGDPGFLHRPEGLTSAIRLLSRRDGEIRQPREFQKLVGFGP